jgi:hypothetical protein
MANDTRQGVLNVFQPTESAANGIWVHKKTANLFRRLSVP